MNRETMRRDATLAAVLGLFGVVTLPSINQMDDVDRAVGWPAFVLVLIAAGALAGRRWRPIPVLVVVTVATASYLTIGYPYGIIMVCFGIAIYSAARHEPLAVAAGWSAAALAASLVHLFTNEAALDGLVGVVPAAAWVAIPFTIGTARRMVAEAGERERAESDKRLVDEERLRLAHEVHDVVGHGLAAIQMQADIALHVRQTNPAQVDVALEAISKASAEALEELRATLTGIRSDTPAPRAPTPGLARLDALCERVRSAGVAVDVHISGERRAVPAAVDVAAYRILQESLTNVVKHSAHPRAEIAVEHRARDIVLRVTNQDLDPEGHAEGFGISGMRNRVAHLGGQLTAGPGPKPGTFEVRAVLPATPDRVTS